MVAAVPLATRGHFCTTAAGAAVSRATWGRFCFGIIVVPPAETEFGGHQFLVFKPITDIIKSQLPVDAEVVPYLATSDTQLEIDGKTYDIVARRSPSEIIKGVKDIERILDDAVEKLGISRRKAKQELYKQVIEELKMVESLKDSVFNDDEEIIMILVATDDI
jgi:hypothetical protein